MHIDSSPQNAHLCMCTSIKTQLFFVCTATFLLQAGFKFWLAANSIAAHYILLHQAWSLRMGLYSGGKKTTNKHAQKDNRQSPLKAMMRDWWCARHKQLSHKWFVSSQLLTRLQRSDEVLWGSWLDSPLVAWMVSRKQTDDFCMCKCFHLLTLTLTLTQDEMKADNRMKPGCASVGVQTNNSGV